MSDPKPEEIAAVPPLSQATTRHALRGFGCDLCGIFELPPDLRIWHEHDEKDHPLQGPASIVYVGAGESHKWCRKRVVDHPRLYVEITGDPGIFACCRQCEHRREDFECANPAQRALGGAGFSVKIAGDALRLRKLGVICTRGAKLPPPHVVECRGRKTRAEIIGEPRGD